MMSTVTTHSSDSDEQNDPFVCRVREVLIGSQYSLIRLLGAGSFGRVYLGRNYKGEEVAIKLEHDDVVPSSLLQEVDAYQSLADLEGFPRVYWYGQQHDFRCMVMELLGPNLEDLLQYCGGRFSLKTTLMLADQLLRRFETFHNNGFLHRDIKPDNFLLGMGIHGNTVYMMDLGLVAYQEGVLDREEVERHTQHESKTREPHLMGTCRYASIQGHFGETQSRYDDLEALGYMFIYLCKGRLPWQGLPDRPAAARYQKVLQLKQETTTPTLCKGLPRVFQRYMDYVRVRKPHRVPDYRYLRGLFSQLFRAQGFIMDDVFDWTILEFQRSA